MLRLPMGNKIFQDVAMVTNILSISGETALR